MHISTKIKNTINTKLIIKELEIYEDKILYIKYFILSDFRNIYAAFCNFSVSLRKINLSHLNTQLYA